MRQNEQEISRNRKWMDLSDYYVSGILNIANMTEMCGLWVASRMQSPQEGFVFGWCSGNGTEKFIVSECINLQNFKMHLQFCNQMSRKTGRKSFSCGVVERLSLAHVVCCCLLTWFVFLKKSNVHLQTEHQAFLLWAGTQLVGRMQTSSQCAF